jgi:hypothetical protein
MTIDDITLGDPLPPELRQLRAAVPVEDPAQVAARRSRLVKALGSEISRASESQRRRKRLYRGLWVSAAAAVLALSIGSGVLVLHRSVGSDDGRSARHDASANASAAVTSPSPTDRVDAAPTARILRSTGETLAALEGPDRPLSAGTRELQTGSTVRTKANGWLALELPGLSQLEVSGSTAVRLAALTAWNQRLDLSRGRIDVSIPKDPNLPPHHLVVVTPDSEVEVRGTVFSVVVEPSPQDPARLVTEVFVARGAVAVRRSSEAGKEELLTVGRRWRSDGERSVESSDVSTAAPAQLGSSSARLDSSSARLDSSSAPPPRTSTRAAQPSAPAEAHAGVPRQLPQRAARISDAATAASLEAEESRELLAEVGEVQKGTKSVAQDPESTLGAQNRLFERALAARDRGALGDAVQALDLLVARYPDSPLYTSARSERARIVERMKRNAAPPASK